MFCRLSKVLIWEFIWKFKKVKNSRGIIFIIEDLTRRTVKGVATNKNKKIIYAFTL